METRGSHDLTAGDPVSWLVIESGWKVIQPVLDAWRDDASVALPTYEAGGSGPQEADELLARDGRRWRPIVDHG